MKELKFVVLSFAMVFACQANAQSVAKDDGKMADLESEQIHSKQETSNSLQVADNVYVETGVFSKKDRINKMTEPAVETTKEENNRVQVYAPVLTTEGFSKSTPVLSSNEEIEK